MYHQCNRTPHYAEKRMVYVEHRRAVTVGHVHRSLRWGDSGVGVENGDVRDERDVVVVASAVCDTSRTTFSTILPCSTGHTHIVNRVEESVPRQESIFSEPPLFLSLSSNLRV